LAEDRTAALVKLRRYDESLIEVGEYVEDDPWTALAIALQDTMPIKAKNCFIFTNAELTTRMDWPRGGPSTWEYVAKWGKWRMKQDEIEEWQRANATKFVVLRQLFYYHWRFVRVGPEKLQSTRRLFDES
jgi:hypothetical protein